MKNKKILIIPAILAVALGVIIYSVCTYSMVSFNLALNQKNLYSCKKAQISKLFPKNGGYRFTCLDTDNKYSLYVTYDTTESTIQGTVKTLRIIRYHSVPNRIKKKPETFYAAWYAGLDKKNFSCERALLLKRKTGERVLDKNIFGGLKNTTIKWFMAKPCGEVVFSIDWPQ